MRVHLLFIGFITALVLIAATNLSAQNCTDASLFLKSDSTQMLNEVRSETGDMFLKVGHHGPAIENEYLGLRIFFNATTAVDVYSKTKKGLELKKFLWYPNAEQQADGWGVDMYKVGSTVGLGGIRLWDGKKVVLLDPVTERIARVKKEKDYSYMEMISTGVPYKGETVDIKVRVTVYCDKREAKVEAEEMSGKKVQFVTGINYHKGNKIEKGNDFVAVWGIHPEDVAEHPVNLGGAIIFNHKVFKTQKDDGEEILLISTPKKSIETWITSANELEHRINTAERFITYVEKIDTP
jgi:hypothetical protein